VSLALAKQLVESDLVTPDQMDDLLQRQVLFGGSLDTNILESKLLDEETLTGALAEVNHLPMATTALISERDPRMANLFPARLAEKHQVAPVMMSGRSVSLLAAGRIHPLVTEEIGFMLSLSVKTYIVCEARLQGFLRAWFGVQIEPRYSVLLDQLGKFNLGKAAQAAPEPEAAALQDTDSQEPAVPVDPARVEKVLTGIEEADKHERDRRAKARSGKLSLEEATRICLRAGSRDDVVDTALRFGRQFSPFVALLIVNNDSILGWDAVGMPQATEIVKRIRLSTGAASVLGTVIQTRAYYLGPVTESIGNNNFLKQMGRTRPRNAFVIPITLKDRLIGLLYGDAGHKTIRGTKLTELLIFTNRLSLAFENLILKIKTEARRGHREAEQWQEVTKSDRRQEEPPDTRVPEPEEPQPGPSADEALADESPGELPQASSAEPKEPSPEPPAVEARQMAEVAAQQALGLEEPLVVEEDFLANTPPVAESDRSAPRFPAASEQRPAQATETVTKEEKVRVESYPPDIEGVVVSDDDSQIVVVDDKTEFAPTAENDLIEPVPVLSDAEDAPSPEGPVADEPEEAAADYKDVSHQEHVERLWEDIDGPDREHATRARDALVSIGPPAVGAIMKRFPGRLLFDIRGSYDSVPPVEEHSALLACLVNIGVDAGEAIAEKLDDPDPDIRYYAVKLLGEIYCPRFVPRLAERLYDKDALIRLTAVDSLLTYRKTAAFDKLLADLRSRLKDSDPNQQAIAAALLGNFKDCDALPMLASLVKSGKKMVSRAAIESLSYITKQDFGSSERKWIKWWKTHKGQRRIQWLIAGLSSRNRDIRFSSAQELTKISNEYFGYYFDSSKQDRERAVRRWEKWWEENGRRMHFDD